MSLLLFFPDITFVIVSIDKSTIAQCEMNDDAQIMADLQRRISFLCREKHLLLDQYVTTLTEKYKLRRLLDRWQAVGTQLYKHNQAIITEMKGVRENARHWRRLCRTNAALSDVREQHIARYKKKAQEANQCSICLNAPMNCLLRPCHHGKFCCGCIQRLMIQRDPQCPLCRTSIRSHHKYFI